MDWRCGSSHRAPALQVPSPEFKPQSHPPTPKKYLQSCTALTAGQASGQTLAGWRERSRDTLTHSWAPTLVIKAVTAICSGPTMCSGLLAKSFLEVSVSVFTMDLRRCTQVLPTGSSCGSQSSQMEAVVQDWSHWVDSPGWSPKAPHSTVLWFWKL
jgi:hypothetical protein